MNLNDDEMEEFKEHMDSLDELVDGDVVMVVSDSEEVETFSKLSTPAIQGVLDTWLQGFMANFMNDIKRGRNSHAR